MAKYLGNALILKVDTNPQTGVYTTIGASSDHTFSLNNEQLDVSDKDSNRWKELLSAGERSATISMNGYVSDNAQFALVEEASKTDTILSYQLEYGDSKLVIGEFHIDTLEVTGSRNTAQNFSITLSSEEEPAIGQLADFLLDENSANILDENGQYIQGT